MSKSGLEQGLGLSSVLIQDNPLTAKVWLILYIVPKLLDVHAKRVIQEKEKAKIKSL